MSKKEQDRIILDHAYFLEGHCLLSPLEASAGVFEKCGPTTPFLDTDVMCLSYIHFGS